MKFPLMLNAGTTIAVDRQRHPSYGNHKRLKKTLKTERFQSVHRGV